MGPIIDHGKDCDGEWSRNDGVGIVRGNQQKPKPTLHHQSHHHHHPGEAMSNRVHYIISYLK